MTAAAKARRTVRHALVPQVLGYLNTQSAMRKYSRPRQILLAARQIAFRGVALGRASSAA